MKKSFRILVALLLAQVGCTYDVWAEMLTEDFETVRLTDANGEVLTSSWSYGYGLSNGWKIVDGTIYGSEGTMNYGLIGWGGHEDSKCIEASYSSANSAFIAIPKKLSGALTFYAAGTASSVEGKVTVYEIESDGDSFRKVATIGTVAPTRYNKSARTSVWNPFTVDLGADGKFIGIEMVRTRLDDLSCEVFQEGVESKAMTLLSFAPNTASVNTNTEGKYTASFTFTVKNTGTDDLTAADHATVSLLDANKQALTTSEPVVLAVGETGDFTLTYQGSVNADGIVKFFVEENLSGKVFASPANVDVWLFGPRFAIDVADGTPQDFGFVMPGTDTGKTFTITNNGNYTLRVMANASPGFVANDLTVAAGSSATLTVAMDKTVPGAKSGTLTLSVNAVDVNTFSLPLSGYMADETKMLVTFDNNRLPIGWEYGATPWTFVDDMAVGGYDLNTRSNSQMITPELTVEANEQMAILIRAHSILGEFSVWYSTDDGVTWTQKKYDDMLTTDFQMLSFGGLPAGTYRLMFEGYKVYIDAINGFALNDVITGIGEAKDGVAASKVFNLQGQRVKPSGKRGLYIVNGKKTMK